MKEIQTTTEPNGFRAISTFSGCGGSSLGYKMAGFRMLWANEFVPAAQEVYRLNHPDTILDTRDIREISPGDILRQIDLLPGELDLLDGSPPCAAFSSSGKKDEGWGIVKEYSDKAQRVDDLFFEFVRILEGVQPKTFVAENVSGLVKGRSKGYFLMILKALRSVGYRVKAQLLDASWLGVPQKRERLIFIGVREDLKLDPVHPRPLPHRYTVRDALTEDLYQRDDYDDGCYKLKDGKMRLLYENVTPSMKGRFQLAHEALFGRASSFNHYRLIWDRASFTAVQGSLSLYHPEEARSVTISELKRLCAFPDDFLLTGSLQQRWERLGRAVPPMMMYHIAKTVEKEILRQCAG
jgi:DNA (cytosine-5)-methyltransferase 1